MLSRRHHGPRAYPSSSRRKPQHPPATRRAILLQFAENDERVNAGWPAYEEAIKKAGVQSTAHHYPGTNHGFHNDTTPRFDEAAAKLAWQRTLEFFKKELAGK